MTTSATPTTAQEAVQHLATLPNLTGVDMSFTAVGPDADGDLSGFRVKLTTEAKNAIAALAQTTRDKLEDAALVPYGPATLVPLQHWMHVDKVDAAVLATVEDVVQRQDLKAYDGSAPYAANVKMVAARFAAKGVGPVTFYRIADSLLQLKKSKIVGLIQQGDVFARLEPAQVLLFRSDFEVIVIDGVAFFTKKATFERAFGFLDELRQESLNTFTTVTKNLRIAGIDDLRAACTSQPQMMAKMASIKRSLDDDPAYAAAMTMPKLINYIEAHPSVDIDVVGKGADAELVFDATPKRRFQIVKLLDDDFLRSVLTTREYEAGSKTRTS